MKKTVLIFIILGILCSAAYPQKGPNERFYKVKAKLDEGGNLYVYIDMKDKIRSFIGEIKNATSGQGVPPQAPFIINMLDMLAEEIGLYSIEDLGVSAVDLGEHKRLKSFLRIPGERKGIFKLVGGAAHEFDILKYAPRDTEFFNCFDLDPAAALSELRRILPKAGGEAALQDFNSNFAQTGTELGVDPEKIIYSLGGEFGIIGTFNREKKITLTSGKGEATLLSSPRVGILARVKDASLYEAIHVVLKKQGIECKEEVGEKVKMLFLPESRVGEYSITPAFGFDGNFVIFSSHIEYLEKILDSGEGKINLGSNALFQKMIKELPNKGNELFYLSESCSSEMMTFSKNLIEHLMKMNSKNIHTGLPIMFLTNIMKKFKGSGATAAVRINEPEGIYGIFTTTGGYLDSVLLSDAAPGFFIVSSMILHKIPVYQARNTQNQVKADLGTMATALEAYNVDYNQYPFSSDMETIKAKGEAATKETLSCLTSPIAYIISIKEDPFSETEGIPYFYYKPTKEKDPELIEQGIHWVLWSVGPDGKSNIASPLDFISPNIHKIAYDPTNGLTSSGDIIRTTKGQYPW